MEKSLANTDAPPALFAARSAAMRPVRMHPRFLSLTERRELEACVRRQREDHGIPRRANALLLLDDGKSCEEIAEFLYLDHDPIRGRCKAYQRDGWEGLAWGGQGNQSCMTDTQEAALCECFPARKPFADAIPAFFRKTIPREWKTFREQVSDNFRFITHQDFRFWRAESILSRDRCSRLESNAEHRKNALRKKKTHKANIRSGYSE